jgi:cytochrome c556
MAKGNKIVEVALAAALFAGCAGSVIAADAATSIATRQTAMKAVAKASITLRNPNSTPADVRAAAKTISDHTKTFAANLPKGSGPEAGVKTKALPAIWTDAKGFKVEMDKALAANAALTKVGDDPAAVKAAAKAVTDTCNSCHDKFREKTS